MTLKISPEISLPIDSVTETFAILAMRGAGKSNAAVVMAEEFFDAKVPWVTIDPKGDWWGIRSSADGKKPGLPIPVFGGRHGDIPLEPTAGGMLASLILDTRLSCVLDVSEFSKSDQRRFLLAFAERLYHEAEEEPLHLFLEEAHEYLPQRVERADAPLVGAMQKLVKQGRFKGLGITLVSQRSAAVNKDVLTQVDTLIAMRNTAPQDRKAISDWVDVHVDGKAAVDSLPTLKAGEAWLWSPQFLGKLVRLHFRRRRTFDSGATPKVGQARRAPSTLADVDLGEIRELMAETIEKVRANDPKELQRQITNLRYELTAARNAEVVEKVVEKIVEVPVVPPEMLAMGRDLSEGLADMITNLTGLKEWVDLRTKELDARSTARRDRAEIAGIAENRDKSVPKPKETKGSSRENRGIPRDPVARDSAREEVKLRAGAVKMLEVVAGMQGFKVTRAMLGTLAGYASRGGTFTTYLGDLKRAGLIVEIGGVVEATNEGFDYIGGAPPPPMTTDEVVAQWSKVLRLGERKMLNVVIRDHPKPLTRDRLAEEVGMEPTGGTFSTYLGVLRRNGLIEVDGQEVRASDALLLP